MFVSGPATDTGHVAARVATDGESPSFVFLGWIKPGVCGPCHGLCLRMAGIGEVYLLAPSP